MSTLTRRINTIPAWKMFTYLLLAFGVWLVCYAVPGRGEGVFRSIVQINPAAKKLKHVHAVLMTSSFDATANTAHFFPAPTGVRKVTRAAINVTSDITKTALIESVSPLPILVILSRLSALFVIKNSGNT